MAHRACVSPRRHPCRRRRPRCRQRRQAPARRPAPAAPSFRAAAPDQTGTGSRTAGERVGGWVDQVGGVAEFVAHSLECRWERAAGALAALTRHSMAVAALYVSRFSPLSRRLGVTPAGRAGARCGQASEDRHSQHPRCWQSCGPQLQPRCRPSQLRLCPPTLPPVALRPQRSTSCSSSLSQPLAVSCLYSSSCWVGEGWVGWGEVGRGGRQLGQAAPALGMGRSCASRQSQRRRCDWVSAARRHLQRCQAFFQPAQHTAAKPHQQLTCASARTWRTT